MKVLAWPGLAAWGANPYCYLLYSEMQSAGCTVEDFITVVKGRPHRLLWDHFEIFHAHWPEHILYQRNWLICVVKLCIFMIIVLILKWRGTSVIWTVHNIEPHREVENWIKKLFYGYWCRVVNGTIYLSRISSEMAMSKYPRLQKVPYIIIPHGHYRQIYSNVIAREEARKRLQIEPDRIMLLCFGRIMRYKGITELIEAFGEMYTTYKTVLMIVGPGAEADYVREVKRLAERKGLNKGDDKSIRIIDRYIAEEDVQIFMNAADMIILPYKNILNSGASLLALSFNKPVIVPSLGSMRELQELVGNQWVYCYAPPLNSENLKRGIEHLLNCDRPAVAPLEPFGWQRIAQQTLSFYRTVMEDG